MGKKLYLVTGATGHVGTMLVSGLLARQERVRALVYPGHGDVPPGVDACIGDVTDAATLSRFFDRSGRDEVILIHCAAFITIASEKDPRVWDVNVNGTRNVMEAALAAGADRVVYVSSVHAIPEKPVPEIITEVDSFLPDRVHGQYAKSKAAAAQIALDCAAKGLNLSIVHPSGIIGPGDTRLRNHMIRTIRAMAAGTIPAAIRGGYDFVDSRDVADGILGCAEHGKPGECYILSGEYITVLNLLNTVRGIAGKKPVRIEMPWAAARALAPLGERLARLLGKDVPIFTPYSVYTLHTNGYFSHEKASRTFGYRPRGITEAIRASL